MNRKCPICNGDGYHTVYEGIRGEASISVVCDCQPRPIITEVESDNIWKDVALASKDVLLETTHKLNTALGFLRLMEWQYEPVMTNPTQGKYELIKTWACPICDAQAIGDAEKKHNPDCTLDAFLKDNEEIDK